jgi:RNA polymerase sigma-70 factor (ECF subfamily)
MKAVAKAQTDESEHTLLARLRAGDDGAFEELVRANGGRMLATARRFLRHEEDARDAVQEAFLQAFRALPGFAGDAKLSTWLHRIVINAALMKLRTQRRRPETSIDDLLPRFDADGHRVLEPQEAADLPDVQLDRAELRALVSRSIARLPESYRAVLVLRDVEDLDTAEAARLLGSSEGAVKTRLHRARQALRTLIERELHADTTRVPARVDEGIAVAAL